MESGASEAGRAASRRSRPTISLRGSASRAKICSIDFSPQPPSCTSARILRASVNEGGSQTHSPLIHEVHEGARGEQLLMPPPPGRFPSARRSARRPLPRVGPLARFAVHPPAASDRLGDMKFCQVPSLRFGPRICTGLKSARVSPTQTMLCHRRVSVLCFTHHV